jgi:linoleoyl-CoA desaturase
MTPPRFSSNNISFQQELKKRINAYFEQNNIAQTGNFALYLKAIILVSSFIATYVHVVFFYNPNIWYIHLIESILIGLLTAAIGFNIMHDGAHGSFSKFNWLNTTAAYTLNFLGASSYMWNIKHNLIHHTFTNIDGVDDDIDAKPFLRMCDTQEYKGMHKYQHRYYWMLYSLLYLYWVFFTDYKKYFSGMIGSMPVKKLKISDHIIFWGFKLLYVSLFIVVPIIFVGFTPWLIGYLLGGLISGYVLSIVFQLAHTVDEAEFPVPVQPANKIEEDWAIHQLQTTANFATKNKIYTWLFGGLNYQIEHHLFPKISHIHYPVISNIVKATCQDFNVKYIEYPKMKLAIHAHVNHLKNMGIKK